MERIAKVEFVEEKTGSYVLNGLMGVAEGQCIRRGTSVWKVSKRRWIKKPHVSLVLTSMDGSWPVVGDEVEIIFDPLEGENPGKLKTDLIVANSMQVDENTQVVWVSGAILPKVGDFLFNENNQKWELTYFCSESKSSGLGTPICLKGADIICTNSRLEVFESIAVFPEVEQTNTMKKPKAKKGMEK